MRTLAARLGLIVALALAPACDYVYNLPTQPTTAAATATPPAVAVDVVEFRVEGDLPIATVRINNSIDGLTQISTILPYTSTVSIVGRDNVFLSLEARAIGVGYLHAAIFINGVIFRESSSSQVGPIVIASGTFRRNQQK